MVQIVNPSIDRISESFLTTGSLAYSGLKEGGIVPSGQQTELAKQSEADETRLNGFTAVKNLTTDGTPTSGFTVAAGEAFIFGAWVIKDSITQLTAPTNSIITIYVGWDKYSANNVIVGQESDFNSEDSKIPIAEVTSNSDGVTDISDLREFVSIDAERLEGKETTDIAADVSDNGSTVVENVGDINVEGGLSASNDGDGSATIVGEAQYTDTDAINAVDSESSLSVDISGDANSVDGFNFVENGNSASNRINYDSTNQNIDIGGQDIANLSIDGQKVEEVTINGSVTWVRAIDATGGTTVIDRTINSVDYRIHAFESVGSSTFSVNQAPAGATVDVLVVGGGGSGGSSSSGSNRGCGGGGGAGGLVFRENISVSEGLESVTVGGGGSRTSAGGSVGDNGNDSIFSGITAFGGGAGGAGNDSGSNGRDGGSGGGAGNDFGNGGNATQPGSSTGGYGNDGGDTPTNSGDMTAGGGGAGGPGDSIPSNPSNEPGGDGGPGLDYSNEFGTDFGINGFFAGGGGGGANDFGGDGNGVGGSGGVGGGGDGGDRLSDGSNAVNNTGSGGGGAGDDFSDGGAGGSGIVLIRYEI